MSTLTLQPAEASAVDCYISDGTYVNTAFDVDDIVVGSTFALGNTILSRGLIRFDLSTLADGAIIDSATLTLTIDTNNASGTPTFTAYRVTRTDWTEAATWNRYDGVLQWTTAGGDKSSTNSSAEVFTSGSTLVFDSLAEMIDDTRNLGQTALQLLLIGPEVAGVTNNLVFHSSADATAGNRPKLEITYTLPVHLQCAQAAQTIIQGLDLHDLPDASIVVRKFPHLRKEDPRPFCILSTHLPVSYTPATNASDDVVYPVTVNLWDQSNSDLTLNQGRMLGWREQIRKAFHQKRLSGVDSVWQCQIPNSQPFNEAWFLSAQKDYSALALNFISRQQRD